MCTTSAAKRATKFVEFSLGKLRCGAHQVAATVGG